MKNVIMPIAKSVLIPLGLIVAATATDEAIQKKLHGSVRTTLIISNKKMKDFLGIVKFLEESGLMNKSVNKTIEKGRLLSMLSDTIGAIFLADKGIIQAVDGTGRVGQGFQCRLIF